MFGTENSEFGGIKYRWNLPCWDPKNPIWWPTTRMGHPQKFPLLEFNHAVTGFISY